MILRQDIKQLFANEEQKRQIRYEQEVFDFLCKHIPVPLVYVPKIPRNATTDQTHEAIDDYIRHIADCYSPEIRERIKQTCFGDPNSNVQWVPGLKVAGNPCSGCVSTAYSQTRITGPMDRVEFSVALDSTFKEAPILRKLILLHEAACHLGQMLDLSQKLGLHDYYNIALTDACGLFLEMSAARIEKAIWNAIPYSVLKAEIRRVPDRKAKTVLSDYVYSKKDLFGYSRMARLAHRDERKIMTRFAIETMKNVPGMRAFDKEAAEITLPKVKSFITDYKWPLSVSAASFAALPFAVVPGLSIASAFVTGQISLTQATTAGFPNLLETGALSGIATMGIYARERIRNGLSRARHVIATKIHSVR